MKNLSKGKLKVQRAHVAWVNTMKRSYPNFNPKRWSENTYRNNHPQLLS